VENKIAIIAIVVRELAASAKVNDLLHEYAPFIVGRMGIPYHDKGVSVISIIADAPPDDISTLAGKLGRITGITVKSVQIKI
jgi:putative iron-only hydrogenase system regulator